MSSPRDDKAANCHCGSEKGRKYDQLSPMYLKLSHVPQVSPRFRLSKGLLEHCSIICLLHTPANISRA